MNTGHFIMWEPPAYMQPHAGEHSELHSDAASRGAGSPSSSSPTALWQGGGGLRFLLHVPVQKGLISTSQHPIQIYTVHILLLGQIYNSSDNQSNKQL